jgi:nucleoside-diphosphate-sugar epimerase
VRVVATDLAIDPVRPRLLLSEEELAQVTFAKLDVTDLNAVKSLVADEGVTHIVHLAGLQMPFCRANPSVGAAVNVVGTVNIFEAARAHWGQVQGLSYASSLAVLGPADLYPERPVRDDVPLLPTTLYGVYKQANEGTAKICCPSRPTWTTVGYAGSWAACRTRPWSMRLTRRCVSLRGSCPPDRSTSSNWMRK